MIRGRLGLIAVVATLAIALLIGRSLSAVMVDQAWYAALGASAIWRDKLLSVLLLKGGAWLLGSAFVFANLWAVRRTIREIAVPTRVGDLEVTEVVPAQRLLVVTLAASALLGMALTLPLNDWTLLSNAWRAEPFSEYEPFFQRDLGFYVNWLPFETALYTWTLVAIVAITALITVLYALTRDLRLVGRQVVSTTHVRRHLTTLGALVLMLLAWSYRLDAYELLLWGSGFDGLFTRVDHRYTSRIDLVLAIGTFAAALIVLRAGWIGQVRAAFVTVTVVIVAALVLRQAGPGVVASNDWVGSADTRDRDYIGTRSIYTRRAYNVEGVNVIAADAPTDSLALGTSIDPARSTVLWDAEVLNSVRGGAESPLTVLIPPAWQSGPSGPEAVLITRTTSLTPVWDVRVIPGTIADNRGAPILARHRAVGSGAVAEPLIAPGFTDHRVVSGDGLLELPGDDALGAIGADPFADRRVPAASLNGWGSRLAHAWATRDVSLLSRDELDEEIAVVLHRDVRARVQRLAPTLAQSEAITPIVYSGVLLWAIELYSASEYYPLSVRFQLAGAPRSYFRHAATALVDAHSGRVRFVPADAPDAVAKTWFARVPTLLVKPELLPMSLRQQLPIATDGAMAQMRAFARVGSRRTGHIARFLPDSLPGVAPYPVATAGPSRDAISWALPLVNDADQLVGVFEAAGGFIRASRWHALEEPFPRWSALRGQISTRLDSAAARTRSESDGPTQLGAARVRVRDGRVSLLRPAYAADAAGQHLIAVAVSTDSGVVTGASLDALFAPETVPTTAGSWRTQSEAARQAESARLYDAMRDALRQSDWTRFGATFDSLGLVLGRVP